MFLDQKKANTANSTAIPKVGYVYDVRMKHHFNLNEDDFPHLIDPHPEDPRRIYWIYDILERSGLLQQMHHVAISPATDRQILRAHSRSHLEFLETTELMEKTSLILAQEKYDDVYLSALSHYCARLSAGGLLALCNEVAKGSLQSGLAIIRPPGHHACQNKPMGFCLLNNIAIAIKELQACSPVQRVLVVDWDIHHGNGIQDMFYADPSVLYISLHRHDNDFFPHGDGGDMKKVGKGKGKGFNINVPWTAEGVGDGDYLYAFRKLILPVAREFGPEMTIVACGFDAAVCDPIGECSVTPECYATMTAMLKDVCPKLVLSLEGGYNLEAIANSALGCAKALLSVKWRAGLVPAAATVTKYATMPEAEINGGPAERKTFAQAWRALPKWSPGVEVSECVSAKPSELGKDVVDRVIREVRPCWKCLQVY